MPAPTNYRCGIDVLFSGSEGVAWQEEYRYWDKPTYDDKIVYLKSNTLISMSHNATNVAASGANSRVKMVVGTGANGGNVGVIRYAFDKMWSRLHWTISGGPTYQAYTGNFNIDSEFYTTGVPVLGTLSGTTGWSNSADPTNRDVTTGYYWRGLTDACGDEWHILKYADDDSIDFPQADGSAYSSDGKFFPIVVNPKTPCLTITTGTTGRFYTTPAYVYFMPVIYQQTTYFQGNCDFKLTDINGNNVFYSINSGGFIDAGSNTVTLNQDNFNSGLNTLNYYYAGRSENTKLRNIVKNPSFPSSAENHGNLLWGDANAFLTISGRVSRFPYSGTYSGLTNRSFYLNSQNAWDYVRNSGYRIGGEAAAWGYGPASSSAFMAKMLGTSAVCFGSTRTYAEYAKEMMLQNAWTVSPLGFELNWGGEAIPSNEINLRGYTDVKMIYEPLAAYDMLMSFYRSDQHSNGVTPIDDYYVRDIMANYVHFCKLWAGGYQELVAAWTAPRNVGATMATIIMPTYSTPYYGTCGMDGNTGVFPWSPSMSGNQTWKSMFLLTGAYQTGLCPYIPSYNNIGLEGNVNGDCLINTTGAWTLKSDYAGYGQEGYSIAIYRNLSYMYAPEVGHSSMDLYLDMVTKSPGAIALETSVSPFRISSVGVINSRFPVPAKNAQAYSWSLPASDSNSNVAGIEGMGGIYGFIFYDDLYSGLVPSLKRWGPCPKFKGYAY